MRKLIILILCIYFAPVAKAQVVNGVLKCGNETFNLLKKVSGSICSKGEIHLSITTHQDLGWVDEVEKCIIMRDTLWMTPFLNRLSIDPGFKMDIEQTNMIYIQNHFIIMLLCH